MRIISKQKDYYDGVQAYNDDSIIFLRKEKEFIITDHDKFDRKNDKHINQDEITQSFNYDKIINPENNWLTRRYYRQWEDVFKYFDNQLMFVGFCGKIYISVMFDLNEALPIKLGGKHQQFCYSTKDFDKIFKKFTTKSEKKSYIKSKQFGNILKFMKTQLSENPVEINNNLFFKYKTPCFVIIPSKWQKLEDKFIISPTLKNYQFTKVFDPYTAFQEIEMFLGGVLGENKEPSTIDDKSMLYKKGFNNMSFKTYKGTKKPRSKRRNK